MTDQEILNKLVKKLRKTDCPPIFIVMLSNYAERAGRYDGNGENSYDPDWDILRIIFQHDFAKAFFGKELIDNDRGGHYQAWQYHLQQMVLEEEPLKYLEQFLVTKELER